MVLKIAFGFRAGVGKSTAVSYLIEKYGGVEASFAAPLYAIMNYAQGMCGFEKVKDRKFLQWVGTEWARQQNTNVWVDRLMDTYDKGRSVYVSDVRFRNEFDRLRAEGFTLICLTRSKYTGFGNGDKQHESETALAGDDIQWDFTIDNNTDNIDDLYTQLDKIVAQIGGM